MPWHTCVQCSNHIVFDDKMYSGGVCPYCGHDSDSTICSTHNEPREVAAASSYGWVIAAFCLLMLVVIATLVWGLRA